MAKIYDDENGQSHTFELTDADLVLLSERITDKNELLSLGEVVLKLPHYEVRSAITNNPGSIQASAHDVLSVWVRQQTNRKTAYNELYDALINSQISYLATECFGLKENLHEFSGTPNNDGHIDDPKSETIYDEPVAEIYSRRNGSESVSVSLRSKTIRETSEVKMQSSFSFSNQRLEIPDTDENSNGSESGTIYDDVASDRETDEDIQSNFPCHAFELTDANVVQLSERIADKNELLRLGEVVLKLPDHRIRSALTNNPRSIQSAAYDVLSIWVRQQTNRKTAYSELQNSLINNEMSYLAKELTEQVGPKENLHGVSKASRFSFNFFSSQRRL